ncbi:MAG: entericidin A/B family lipoprotein [Phycisphaerales bacterium]|nr:entericidin A/B family lipoprotein [Phycisphaerales bacterium]
MTPLIPAASSLRLVPALRWVLLAMACSFALTFLVACHTVEGAGKDIESAGEGIQDAAD